MSALRRRIENIFCGRRSGCGAANALCLPAGALCACVWCLTMLCACGTQPSRTVGDAAQEASEPPAVFDPYDLPLFDELPENHSAIDPSFWAAESQNGGKVYLLGSIHTADKTAYRLPQHIMDAYLNSDALAVEVDILAYAADPSAQRADAEQTTYPDGDTLQNHIAPALYLQLVRFIQDNAKDPQTPASLENRRPCIWLSALAEIEADAAGLSPQLGIDRHFLELAHAQEKEIIEIESSASQYDALNRVSDTAYEVLFSQYVFQTPEHLGEAVRVTYDQWKAGELRGSPEAEDGELYAEVSDEAAAMADYMRILFTDRNAVMTDRVETFLDAGQTVFCLIGAEHLLGSGGVIARLEADGYRLTRLGGAANTQM